jgi:hypothetical protein
VAEKRHSLLRIDRNLQHRLVWLHRLGRGRKRLGWLEL